MTKQTKPPEGELITAKLIAKHERYKKAYEKGLANACMALYRIRVEKTYAADGHNDFIEFLNDWALAKSRGYAMAAAGPVFRLLENSAQNGIITSLDQLRPITKMTPDRQVLVIQQAESIATEKRKDGTPKITAKLIEEVAAEHFSWFPKAKKPSGKSPILERIERASKILCEIPLTPDEAVETFGDPRQWTGFPAMRDYVNAIWEIDPPKAD